MIVFSVFQAEVAVFEEAVDILLNGVTLTMMSWRKRAPLKGYYRVEKRH